MSETDLYQHRIGPLRKKDSPWDRSDEKIGHVIVQSSIPKKEKIKGEQDVYGQQCLESHDPCSGF